MAQVVGQSDLIQRFAERLTVSRSRGWPFPHILIEADEGMGRHTIARSMAEDIAAGSKVVEVIAVTKALDLTGLLVVVEAHSCVVIPNLDVIDSGIVRPLVPVLKSGILEFNIGTGPNIQIHGVPLPEFTVIATCRSRNSLPVSVLSGFTVEVLARYDNMELAAIARLQAIGLGFDLDGRASLLAASSADSTPGSIHSLLTRVRRYAGTSPLDQTELQSILNILGIRPKRLSSGTGLLDDLVSMSGEEFEQWTAVLFRNHGYRVTTTRMTGDHGIDLAMERDERRVVVQCKRWSDTVGEPAIREFYGAILNARADAGIFVTTSSFSTQARRFIEQKPITLLDLRTLVDLFLYGGDPESIPHESGHPRNIELF